jgi:hypothetical protein
VNSRLRNAYARITRTIEAGTASIVDVAWVTIRGKLNALAGATLGNRTRELACSRRARGGGGDRDPHLARHLISRDGRHCRGLRDSGRFAIAWVGLTRRPRRWQFVGQGVTSAAVGALALLLPKSRRWRCCTCSPFGWSS